jgi:hypothetical protein
MPCWFGGGGISEQAPNTWSTLQELQILSRCANNEIPLSLWWYDLVHGGTYTKCFNGQIEQGAVKVDGTVFSQAMADVEEREDGISGRECDGLHYPCIRT